MNKSLDRDKKRKITVCTYLKILLHWYAVFIPILESVELWQDDLWIQKNEIYWLNDINKGGFISERAETIVISSNKQT